MTEPKFIPKPGQSDYTNAARAPVINCVVQYREKILLVQRSSDLRFHPDYWNGISGFLDDDKSVEAKAEEELQEELGIAKVDIVSIAPGEVFEQEESEYNKTWIVHPVLVVVRTDALKLDWEAKSYEWVLPAEAKTFNLLPGFERVLESVLPLSRF